MQYLRRLHSCLTFHLQNEAALLRNKTTQSQSYYILFCGAKKCYLTILFMKQHHSVVHILSAKEQCQKLGKFFYFNCRIRRLISLFVTKLQFFNNQVKITRRFQPIHHPSPIFIIYMYTIYTPVPTYLQCCTDIMLKKNPNALDPSALNIVKKNVRPRKVRPQKVRARKARPRKVLHQKVRSTKGPEF